MVNDPCRAMIVDRQTPGSVSATCIEDEGNIDTPKQSPSHYNVKANAPVATAKNADQNRPELPRREAAPVETPGPLPALPLLLLQLGATPDGMLLEPARQAAPGQVAAVVARAGAEPLPLPAPGAGAGALEPEPLLGAGEDPEPDPPLGAGGIPEPELPAGAEPAGAADIPVLARRPAPVLACTCPSEIWPTGWPDGTLSAVVWAGAD